MEYRLTVANNLGERAHLLYRPLISELVWEHTGKPINLSPVGFMYQLKEWETFTPISPEMPGLKSRELKTIKIQLGMKCNYACAYCNQASQPHDNQGNLDDVKHFLSKIGEWFDGGKEGDGTGIRFEPWGGEPLVYWKQLRYLVSGLKSLYPKATFNMITNASILTPEIIDWIDSNDVSIGISHDGPGYSAQRGVDPLDDPEQLRLIRLLYNRLRPFGRISFNAVLTTMNYSLSAVRTYIANRLDVPEYELQIETEELLQPYDAGGLMLSPVTEKDHSDIRSMVFYEAASGMTAEIGNIANKLRDFYESLAFRRPWTANGQKCGMDDKGNIAVSLKGDAMTCQNTSPDTKHKIGSVYDFDNIRLDTGYHMTKRKECGKCPVVQLCKGACLFNVGTNWERGCDNSFTYNVGMLAVAIYWLTNGLILEKINGTIIRREDITEVAVIDPYVASEFNKRFHPLPVPDPV